MSYVVAKFSWFELICTIIKSLEAETFYHEIVALFKVNGINGARNHDQVGG